MAYPDELALSIVPVVQNVASHLEKLRGVYRPLFAQSTCINTCEVAYLDKLALFGVPVVQNVAGHLGSCPLLELFKELAHKIHINVLLQGLQSHRLHVAQRVKATSPAPK